MGRTTKTAVFLGMTAITVGWELMASFDHDPDTMPWTDLIVTYIPGEITTVVIGGLCLWLPVHFGVRYYRRYRDRRPPGGEANE